MRACVCTCVCTCVRACVRVLTRILAPARGPCRHMTSTPEFQAIRPFWVLLTTPLLLPKTLKVFKPKVSYPRRNEGARRDVGPRRQRPPASWAFLPRVLPVTVHPAPPRAARLACACANLTTVSAETMDSCPARGDSVGVGPGAPGLSRASWSRPQGPLPPRVQPRHRAGALLEMPRGLTSRGLTPVRGVGPTRPA